MLRRSVTLVLITFLGGLLTFGLATPATAAAVQCDAVINDDADLFGGRDEGKVKDEVGNLERMGADVRVVTLRSFAPSSTLDAYVESRVQDCPSWQSPNGMRKNNLLVFIMSMKERKLGIFYGESWLMPIQNGGGDERIWAQYMAPQFKGGNFADGFVDGMVETRRVLEMDANPGSGSGVSGGEPVNSEPTDLTGLWIVLGSIVGLIASVLLVVFLWRIYSARKEADEARKAAQTRAKAARDATTNLTDGLGGDAEGAVRRAKVAKYSAAGVDVAQELREALETIKREREASTTATAMVGTDSVNVNDDGLTLREYQDMEVRYTQARDHAQAAVDAAKFIDRKAKEIDAALAQLSEDKGTLEVQLDKVKADLQSLRDEGIGVDAIDALLQEAYRQVGQISENTGDLSALASLHSAASILDEAEAAYDALQQTRQQLEQDIPALEQRIAAARITLNKARQCFERISSTYASASWQSVAGNGSEAEQRIDAAVRSHEEAQQKSALESQDWGGALSAIQEGNLLLDQAEGMLRSITELEKNLEQAQRNAEPEINAAVADIDKARQYIDTYDGDIRDSLEDDLREAARLLDEARDELAKELPDYLRVIELALKANSKADRIYDEAVEEHEAAERLRRQAATTLQSAEAAVSKADEFIDDHRSDVGSNAEQLLSSARSSLRQAKQAGDLQIVLRYASVSLKNAQAAYAKAKRDFDDAEEERERARRYHSRSSSYGSNSFNYTNVTIGNSGGFSGGWGSGGGGGIDIGGGSSGSWSSSGGGGGGSSGSW